MYDLGGHLRRGTNCLAIWCSSGWYLPHQFKVHAHAASAVCPPSRYGTLTGSPATAARDELVISPNSPAHLLARKGKWVYIPARNEGGFQQPHIGDHGLGGAAAFTLTGQTNSDFTADGELKKGAPPAQLYDLENDPRQAVNVYARHPDIVEQLDRIVAEHRKKIGPFPRLGWIALEQAE